VAKTKNLGIVKMNKMIFLPFRKVEIEMGNEHPSFFITNNIFNNINIKLHICINGK